MLEVIMSYLAYPNGLYALLALIPLIIIYLIRPKPKKKEIPALMFLLKERTKSTFRSFFRTVFKDWLLLLQIIILILIAIAVAQPFINVTQSVLVDETVLIIDDSASSQTSIDGKTRFETGIEIAKEMLTSKNTVILASAYPQVISEHKSAAETRRVLSELKPKDTTTNLYDAILMADNYITGRGRVIVISDFIETETGLSYQTAAKMLETKNTEVIFKNTGEKRGKNIGIIDLNIEDEQTTVLIKNYNNEQETVKIKVEDTEADLEIDAGSVEHFVFDTLPGTTKIELITQDDLAVDNIAYTSMPEKETINVLMITNDKGLYLYTALSVLKNVNIEIAAPPKVPEITSSAYDVIIIKNVNPTLILPGTIKDIEKAVKAGSGLIITAQDGLFQIDLKGMMPVEFKSMAEDANVFAPDTALTRDVNFGFIDKYFDVELKDGGIIASTDKDIPIIALKSYNLGNVIYYGIFDEDGSDFKYDTYYPIFWKRVLDLLSGKDDPDKINFKTGKILSFEERTRITAPTKTVRENLLVMDEVGLYEIEQESSKKLAANLLNEFESDINGDFTLQRDVELKQEKTTEKVKLNLMNHTIALIAILVFLELLIIKLRGDL